MSLRFPSADRVPLKRSPLELVVCQVRFPTILSLANGAPPGAFEERIREKYPVPSQKKRVNIELEQGSGALRRETETFWSFEDEAGEWTVSLGQGFLSLETKNYESFDTFLTRFDELVEAIKSEYKVTLQDRLGLRYVDRISRTRDKRLPENWKDQLPAELIPLRKFSDAAVGQLANFETRLAFGDAVLAIRCNFVDKSFPGSTEDELILDFDCYSEKRAKIASMKDSLSEFRKEAYAAFRWAIGDLIEHLRKEPVS